MTRDTETGDPVTEADEQAARRIADRGRDAVVRRLRPMFADAASAHSHLVLVPVGPADLERMVQAAADRADGVLWRRALAGLAAEELGLTLGEAISHPLVRRAHELAGAPAYDPDRESTADGDRDSGARPDPNPEPEVARMDPDSEAEPEDLASTGTEPPVSTAALPVSLVAVHISGIETLREGARNIELRFSEAGLDVVDTGAGRAIGRLTWEDITQLELPRRRRARRQSRDRAAQLRVGTSRGEARFELSGLTDEQGREHLAPVFARAQGAVRSARTTRLGGRPRARARRSERESAVGEAGAERS